MQTMNGSPLATTVLPDTSASGGPAASDGAQAAGLASRLKHAGARSVLLAGSPNDAYPDVDTFLYRGCDALAVLHTTLEVAR